MADVLHPADKPTPSSGSDNASSINLLDLSHAKIEPQKAPSITVQPESVTLPLAAPDKFHLTKPEPDADLNRKYAPINPGAWESAPPLQEYYQDGVVKLMSDPDGKQQFGVRISDQKSDRFPIVPIGRQHLNEKGVALQWRLKF